MRMSQGRNAGNIDKSESGVCGGLYPDKLVSCTVSKSWHLNMLTLTLVFGRIDEMIVSSSAFSRSRKVVARP